MVVQFINHYLLHDTARILFNYLILIVIVKENLYLVLKQKAIANNQRLQELSPHSLIVLPLLRKKRR